MTGKGSVELDSKQKQFPVTKSSKRTRRYGYKCKEVSSYKVFLRFVNYSWNMVNGESICNATGILSKECYQQWLSSRRTFPKKPEEAFRRALTAHCRGVDGRRPFPEEVEKSLLTELRQKKQWRCFEGLDKCGSIGVQGFPSLGYHEKRKHQAEVNVLKTATIPTRPTFERSVPPPQFGLGVGLSFMEPLDLFAEEMAMYEHLVPLLDDSVEVHHANPLKKVKTERKNSLWLEPTVQQHPPPMNMNPLLFNPFPQVTQQVSRH